MKRRRVLGVAASAVAATAGCIADGSDTAAPETQGETATPSETDTPVGPTESMVLERVEHAYPEALSEPTPPQDATVAVAVDTDQERGVVGVAGTEQLPNSCYVLRVSDTGFEDGQIHIDLAAEDTSEDDVACTTAIHAARYELGFYFSNFDPGKLDAVVVNDSTGADTKKPIGADG